MFTAFASGSAALAGRSPASSRSNQGPAALSVTRALISRSAPVGRSRARTPRDGAALAQPPLGAHVVGGAGAALGRVEDEGEHEPLGVQREPVVPERAAGDARGVEAGGYAQHLRAAEDPPARHAGGRREAAVAVGR